MTQSTSILVGHWSPRTVTGCLAFLAYWAAWGVAGRKDPVSHGRPRLWGEGNRKEAPSSQGSCTRAAPIAGTTEKSVRLYTVPLPHPSAGWPFRSALTGVLKVLREPMSSNPSFYSRKEGRSGGVGLLVKVTQQVLGRAGTKAQELIRPSAPCVCSQFPRGSLRDSRALQRWPADSKCGRPKRKEGESVASMPAPLYSPPH